MATVVTHDLPMVGNSSSLVFRRIDERHEFPADTNLVFIKEIAERLRLTTNSSSEVQDSIHRLFIECARLRNNLSAEDWRQCVKTIRESELVSLVHEDPFTHRAFSKPRGYAGDAVMMDYIYGAEENWYPPTSSLLGNRVYQYTTSAAASSGVRSRREFIAEQLDDVARNRVKPSVLAVACGHLREASMSSAVRRRRFGDFIALDADGESLNEVDRNYGRFGIRTELADIRKMLTGKLEHGQFDLIYSTGLYDYLNQKTGKKLTHRLFSMLRPGGKLVIANFLPTIVDIGYMEAFMDWYLIYRDRTEMMGLTELIDQEQIREIRVSVEENQNIIFLELSRS